MATTIEDVRRALWSAYKRQEQSEYGVEGKSYEAACEVYYPTFWDCKAIDDFLRPCGLMVYSYALGPSRGHYFNRSKLDRQVDINTWESPDPFAKAVEVINGWAREGEGE